MSRTKAAWRLFLFSVGMGLRSDYDRNDPEKKELYSVKVSFTLERDPERQVFMELSVSEAERLRESLERPIAEAKRLNKRNELDEIAREVNESARDR